MANALHVPYTHLLLIKSEFSPPLAVPIHDTIWKLFFGHDTLLSDNRYRSASAYYFYSHGLQRLPIAQVYLQEELDAEALTAFIDYMYLGSLVSLYQGWLGPSSDKNVESMGRDYRVALFSRSLSLTEVFLEKAKQWGVKDQELYSDLQFFLDDFSEDLNKLKVSAPKYTLIFYTLKDTLLKSDHWKEVELSY